jgi:hypothetical protein
MSEYWLQPERVARYWLGKIRPLIAAEFGSDVRIPRRQRPSKSCVMNTNDLFSMRNGYRACVSHGQEQQSASPEIVETDHPWFKKSQNQ